MGKTHEYVWVGTVVGVLFLLVSIGECRKVKEEIFVDIEEGGDQGGASASIGFSGVVFEEYCGGVGGNSSTNNGSAGHVGENNKTSIGFGGEVVFGGGVVDEGGAAAAIGHGEVVYGGDGGIGGGVEAGAAIGHGVGVGVGGGAAAIGFGGHHP